eukprot:gene5294-6592_t
MNKYKISKYLQSLSSSPLVVNRLEQCNIMMSYQATFYSKQSKKTTPNNNNIINNKIQQPKQEQQQQQKIVNNNENQPSNQQQQLQPQSPKETSSTNNVNQQNILHERYKYFYEKQQQQRHEQSQFNGGGNNNMNQSKFKRLWDKLSQHAISFVVFGAFSFGLAVYQCSRDETEHYIKHIDEYMEKFNTIQDYQLFISRLKSISEYSSNNTKLQQLLSDPKYINQLLNMILDYSDVDINIYSAKIIENASHYITDYSVIPKLVEVGSLQYVPQYVKKSIGISISKIAEDPTSRILLANSGAIPFLERLLQSKLLRFQAFKTALQSISYTCSNNIDKLDKKILTPQLKESIEKYANIEKEVQSSVYLSKKRDLLQSGWTLYLHTSAGGFVWGCFESIRNKLPLKTILLNGCKNSIITAGIPILFVGIVTTLFNDQYKKLNTTQDKFMLFFFGTYSLYPMHYLLPVIERFSPYWIGGHVLGFMSFFSYLVYTENDIFKSDNLIMQKDRIAPPRDILIENLKKKELEQQQQSNK